MIAFYAMINNQEDLTKFHLIYEKYKNLMYHIAHDIMLNQHDAEDIVQQSLIKLIHVLYKFDMSEISQSYAKNLVATITRNTAIDCYRKANHGALPSDRIDSTPVSSKSSEDLYIEAEDYKTLILCIDELDDKYKDVLRLRVMSRLSSKETAEILNINVSAVNTRFLRAKKILAMKLEEKRIK